jgi:hypothetical protein
MMSTRTPGITGNYKTGSPYSAVPTNSIGSPRANLGYIAGRMAFSLNGTLTSCTRASGPAAVTRFDAHTLGCRLTGGSDCGSSDSNYLDSNAPAYTPGSASFSLVKVANNASCSEIRSANP